MGKPRTTAIRYVCSDMWQPYLRVIRKKIPDAIHILDRFHIVARLNKAFNVAKDQLQYIKSNPCAGIKQDKLAETDNRYVTPEEFAKLREACRYVQPALVGDVGCVLFLVEI